MLWPRERDWQARSADLWHHVRIQGYRSWPGPQATVCGPRNGSLSLWPSCPYGPCPQRGCRRFVRHSSTGHRPAVRAQCRGGGGGAPFVRWVFRFGRGSAIWGGTACAPRPPLPPRDCTIQPSRGGGGSPTRRPHPLPHATGVLVCGEHGYGECVGARLPRSPPPGWGGRGMGALHAPGGCCRHARRSVAYREWRRCGDTGHPGRARAHWYGRHGCSRCRPGTRAWWGGGPASRGHGWRQRGWALPGGRRRSWGWVRASELRSCCRGRGGCCAWAASCSRGGGCPRGGREGWGSGHV
jgi:hypothetical protein